MSDYIPLELISNILARLPVEDVLRCTSVCKSWYSLITSASFASLHQNLSSSNQEPRMLVRYYKSGNSRARYCLHCDDQTFDKIEELDPPLHGRFGIIDILNGLVCLRYYEEHAIGLWNPSLRKYLILPKPRILHQPVGWFSDCGAIGFGFVATTNEYKIVWYQYSTKTGRTTQIYQLSIGSWRDVKLGDFLNFPVNRNSQQAHLKGILHWQAHCPKQNDPAFSE